MTDNKTQPHSKDEILHVAHCHMVESDEHDLYDRPNMAEFHKRTAAMLRAYAEVVEDGKDRILAALERASKAESLLRLLADECDASSKAGWEDRMTDYIAQANALLSSSGKSPCQTCMGHGMIGGPSFYDPGEGGEPCPDCYRSKDGYVEFLDVQNHRLRNGIRAMMAYLAPILDEDHFNRADEMVRDLDVRPHDPQWEKDRRIGEAWRLDSSLEKWFPITAEELAKLRQQVTVSEPMVEKYVWAVDNYLGSLTEAEWEADRKDKRGHLRRVARIGLTAALSTRGADAISGG